MTATLIIWTCLISGSDCRPEAVHGMTMLQCNVGWQMEAAKFVSDHPDRKFERYECLPGDDEA